MKSTRRLAGIAALVVGLVWFNAQGADDPATWRAQHRIIDLHQHVGGSAEALRRNMKIMDVSGIGLVVNLSGGYVTPGRDGAPSAFERNRDAAEKLYPGRYLQYFSIDYRGWDEPDWPAKAAAQVERAANLGAAGLKEYKRLGLFLRDGQGQLIRVDDSKLDPVWAKCGELKMPVSIHVADPKAFWLPFDSSNERWDELGDHRDWWFGDTNKYPSWKSLLEALDRVIGKHPRTTFVSVHFANNAEELDWVEAALDRHPNMMADLAARIPELGRHDPEKVRRLFIKHQDRILFATDFQTDGRLILGSSGNEPPPSDADAEVFFTKHWRWLETRDRDWAHMTPIQGRWTISSIGLPEPVLRKIYFDNARRLLGRSLPLPVAKARRMSQDFPLDGSLTHPLWAAAKPVLLECRTQDYGAMPEVSTEVRVLWSKEYLYLGYRCPYKELTVYKEASPQGERHSSQQGVSLWDRDVVESFIASDPSQLKRYDEVQVAPTNERLDLKLQLPERDFEWQSGMESAVRIDEAARVWTCEMRIPMKSLAARAPATGERWRINFFRCDRAHDAFLAWSPTLSGSFHTPDKFGWLEFTE